jgi:hypothetical protein
VSPPLELTSQPVSKLSCHLIAFTGPEAVIASWTRPLAPERSAVTSGRSAVARTHACWEYSVLARVSGFSEPSAFAITHAGRRYAAPMRTLSVQVGAVVGSAVGGVLARAAATRLLVIR